MSKTVINIRKLGAIRDSKITISPLMIFSGESGLGKSYVAFLVHYLYRIVLEGNRISGFFTKLEWDYEKFPSDKNSNELSVSVAMLEKWLDNDAVEYLREITGNNKLEADISFKLPSYKNGTLKFSYKKDSFVSSDKEIVSTLFELDKYGFRVQDGARKLGVLPWTKLLVDLLKDILFNDNRLEQTFTMVPGRGALLNIDFKFQESVKNNAGMYAEFLNDWQVVKEIGAFDNVDQSLYQRLITINGGTIVQTEEAVFLQIGADKLLPISAAASSIKELAPLAMLYEKIPADRLSILFEEPEAHLHPLKQVAMADFVVEAVSKGTHMQITTHSDYFIRRLNDCIMLEKIRKSDEQEYARLKKAIKFDGDDTLDPSIVSAYLLVRKGDENVVIKQQNISKGIPYDTFHDVLVDNFNASMEINRVYNKMSND